MFVRLLRIIPSLFCNYTRNGVSRAYFHSHLQALENLIITKNFKKLVRLSSTYSLATNLTQTYVYYSVFIIAFILT